MKLSIYNLIFKKSRALGFLAFFALLFFSACDSYSPSSLDPTLSEIPAGTVMGTVYDAATGQAIAGVAISTSPKTKSAVTSSNGTFTLSDIAIGTFDLIASKDGYSASTTEDMVLTDEAGVNLSIWLYQGGGVITGTVSNTRGALLSDVTVEVISETTNQSIAKTTTDSSGYFSITDLSTDTFKVSFTPNTGSYRNNEKVHLQLIGSHVINMILSGKTPDSATYVGSSACETCHAAQTETYLETPHAGVLKEPAEMSVPALARFESGETLELSDGVNTISVALSLDSDGTPQMILNASGPYVIQKIYGGSRWKENYLVESGTETFVLPVAWSLALNDFVLDNSQKDNWISTDGSVSTPGSSESYEQRCVGCHTSGFTVSASAGKVVPHSTSGGGADYLEDFVGCERCHGPGSSHASSADTAAMSDSLLIVQPRYLSLEANTQVCGQCHAGGHDKKFTEAELDYPVDETGKLYQPGADLDDYLDNSGDQWGSSGYSKAFHQEYGDYLQSKHYSSTMYNPRCSDCHDAHGSTSSDNPNLLKYSATDNTLCLNCHTAINFPDEYSIRIHTQHPYDPEGTGASRCIGCHLTKTGTVDQFTDVGGHKFAPVKPSQTLDMLNELQASGETNIAEEDLIPNPCMQCHNQVLAEAQENGESANALGGDPTSEAYLTLLTEAYELKFEEAKLSGTYASFSHKVIQGWMDPNSSDHHGKYYIDNPETCTNSCHGKDLQGGELSDGSNVPSCFDCHYAGPHDQRLKVDGWVDEEATTEDIKWTWIQRHKYYYTENGCTLCHGADYNGGITGVSCYQCHESPGVDFTVFTEGCENQGCHGTPPAMGAHDVHYNGVYYENAANPKYGDTTNYSTAEAYRFGCGTCHPMSSDKHRNGSVDIELYNEHADPETMKGKMPSNAQFDSETRTCTNVYCHSYTEYTGSGGGKLTVPYPLQPDEVATLGGIENQIAELNGSNIKKISSYFIWNGFAAPDDNKEAYYWGLPVLFSLDALCDSGSTDPLCAGGVDSNGIAVSPYDTDRFGYSIDYPDYEVQQVRRYQTTPNWDGPDSLACNGCHGFPPRSFMTEDEWSETDPDWSDGAPNIQKEAAIDKHSFVIPKLDANGNTIEVGHMANMRPFSNAPLRCQTCHYETVSKVDLKDWESGNGWSREEGKVKIENLSIADKSYHANGKIDVVFDTSGPVTSYRYNNINYPYLLKENPARNSDHPVIVPLTQLGYYYGVKGKDAPGATWNAETKTCSNVSCHLEQVSVTWTKPYRPDNKAECFQCHQYYSDPTRGEDETMCWPHSDRNGCETKELDIEIMAPMELENSHWEGP